MPQDEWRYWDRPAFLNSLPCLPFEFKATRGQPAGGNALVPASLIAIIGLALMAPVWHNVHAMLPLNSWIKDIAEYAPLMFIVLCAVSGELFMDTLVALKKRTSMVRFTDDGIEVFELGRKQKMRWSDVNQIIWENDPGRSSRTYMVAQLESPGNQKIRVSEQFFTDKEVELVYGFAMIMTGGRTLR